MFALVLMRQLLLVHIVPEAETLATRFANKWFCAAMDQLVVSQFLTSFKLNTAHLTNIRFGGANQNRRMITWNKRTVVTSDVHA